MVLTWIAEGGGPHLGEGLDDLPEILQMDPAAALLIEQVETLLHFLLLGSVEHYIEVTEVLLQRDTPILLRIHHGPHAVAQETQGVDAEDAERLLIGSMGHLASIRELVESTT